MSLYGVIGYHVTICQSPHNYMGVIGYHVTFSEGHMIASHPI